MSLVSPTRLHHDYPETTGKQGSITIGLQNLQLDQEIANRGLQWTRLSAHVAHSPVVGQSSYADDTDPCYTLGDIRWCQPNILSVSRQ